MRIRKQFFMLMVFTLAISVFVTGSARAQAEPANIVPYADGAVYEVSTDQEVHIFWVWLALNPGLVNVYLDASHETYTFDGPFGSVSISDSQAEQMWSPIIEAPPAVLGWECPRPLAAGSIFDYNLGHLEPGQYTLTFERTLDHAVNDGLHVCAIESQPLADAPSLFGPGTTVSTVTINVSAGG